MRQETRDEWTKRVERWRDSGQTAMEFAAELGVNHKTLENWSYRLRHPTKAKRGAEEKALSDAADWIEITGASERAHETPFEIVVARDAATVRVPSRFDAAALRRLLCVLQAR